MVLRRVGLTLVLLAAGAAPCVAVGQSPTESSNIAAQPSLEADARQFANLIGIDSELQKLSAVQALRPPGAPPTLEELAIRQKILETVQSCDLQVDGVIAELSNEESEISAIRTEMQARRDKKVSRLTTAALITGAGLGVAVSATQFTTLSNTTQNVGDGIAVGSGTASLILTILAARAQKGPQRSISDTPNMLAPLLGGTPMLNTYYPPVVLQYLRSVPVGEASSRGTRLQQLQEQWGKTGRLSMTDSAKRRQKIAALTASGDPNTKVSIGDLTDRIAMLGDVRGRVSLIKRDLSTLVLFMESKSPVETKDGMPAKKN